MLASILFPFLCKKTPEYLLVHGYTGALDIVSPNLYQFLLNAEQDTKKQDQLPQVLEKYLLQRGYLIPHSMQDEQAYFIKLSTEIHKKKIQYSQNAFWVIPTYKCNLRCHYCFQEHALHRDEGEETGTLRVECLPFLFSALEKLGGSRPHSSIKKTRYITLFGGEPLMLSTRKVVFEVAKRASQEGYKLGAVTNGLELENFKEIINPKHLRWLQITLDGLKITHDKRRYLPMAKDNFENVVRNIDLALKAQATVCIRTNVDREILESIDRIEDFAYSMGWDKYENFRWVAMPVESHINPTTKDREVTPLEIFNTIRKKKLNIIRPPYRGPTISLLNSLTTNSIFPHIKTSSCGAHTGMYFFDPLGFIYTCSEQAGKPQFSVGSYSEGKLMLDENKLGNWHNRHVGNIIECAGCSYAFFCGGGCANAALMEKKYVISSQMF